LPSCKAFSRASTAPGTYFLHGAAWDYDRSFEGRLHAQRSSTATSAFTGFRRPNEYHYLPGHRIPSTRPRTSKPIVPASLSSFPRITRYYHAQPQYYEKYSGARTGSRGFAHLPGTGCLRNSVTIPAITGRRRNMQTPGRFWTSSTSILFCSVCGRPRRVRVRRKARPVTAPNFTMTLAVPADPFRLPVSPRPAGPPASSPAAAPTSPDAGAGQFYGARPESTAHILARKAGRACRGGSALSLQTESRAFQRELGRRTPRQARLKNRLVRRAARCGFNIRSYPFGTPTAHRHPLALTTGLLPASAEVPLARRSVVPRTSSATSRRGSLAGAVRLEGAPGPVIFRATASDALATTSLAIRSPSEDGSALGLSVLGLRVAPARIYDRAMVAGGGAVMRRSTDPGPTVVLNPRLVSVAPRAPRPQKVRGSRTSSMRRSAT
jgi:hypothetical protein